MFIHTKIDIELSNNKLNNYLNIKKQFKHKKIDKKLINGETEKVTNLLLVWLFLCEAQHRKQRTQEKLHREGIRNVVTRGKWKRRGGAGG